MDSGLLCLKWKDHQCMVFRMLSSARKKEMYCDVTIACDEKFYPVHKLILSSCSDYFAKMFEGNADKNLMIVLTDISHKVWETLSDFMYTGEVNILQNELAVFMKAAERLKIKGFADIVQNEYIQSMNYAERQKTTMPVEPSDEIREIDRTSNKQSISVKEKSSEPKRRKLEHSDNFQQRNPESYTSNVKQLNGKHLSSGSKESESEVQVRRFSSSATTPLINLVPDSGTQLQQTHESSHSHPSQSPQLPNYQKSEEVKFEDISWKEEPEDWTEVKCEESSSLFVESGLSDPTYLSSLAVEAQPAHLGHQFLPVPGPSTMHTTKSGRPTSEIWKHYRSEKVNGKTIAYCKYCLQKYGHPNATKMKAHIFKCKSCPEAFKAQLRNLKNKAEYTEKPGWIEAPVPVRVIASRLSKSASRLPKTESHQKRFTD